MTIGISVYLKNASVLVGNKLPMPFGYGAAVVLSGSMEPEFSKNDLIIVKATKDIHVSDIVVFESENSLIVHRIIDIDDESIITQGDANSIADDPISLSQIKGKVIYVVPFAGHIVNFIKTPIGILLLIAGAIALVEIPRRREKLKDEEAKQLIIDEIKKLKEEIND